MESMVRRLDRWRWIFNINKKEQSVRLRRTTHTTEARVLYNIKNTLKVGNV